MCVQGMGPGYRERKFLSLLEQRCDHAAASGMSGAATTGRAASAKAVSATAASSGAAASAARGNVGTVSAAPLATGALESPRSSSRSGGDGPGDVAAVTDVVGAGEDEEDAEALESYHEVHAIPLLDPVLDEQVILLVQVRRPGCGLWKAQIVWAVWIVVWRGSGCVAHADSNACGNRTNSNNGIPNEMRCASLSIKCRFWGLMGILRIVLGHIDSTAYTPACQTHGRDAASWKQILNPEAFP
eukprot:270746-Chlamydomonas_euryale.AAC.10